WGPVRQQWRAGASVFLPNRFDCAERRGGDMNLEQPAEAGAKVARCARRVLKNWQGVGILVAVSGGSDSVGLVRIVHALAFELGLTMRVAHLNHGARGSDAIEDAQFVKDLAESLRVPFELG